LCRMLATPQFMQRWVNAVLHTRPDNVGKNGTHVATSYITQLIELVLTADLTLEIDCTVGFEKTWRIHPFGFACRHISIPVELYHDEPAFMAALQRMVLVEHGNVASPVYSAYGGAFSRTNADIKKNHVFFSGFAYNQTLDFHFPRAQFVACYCAILCAQSRYIDTNRGIDVNRVLSIKNPLENVSETHKSRYADSESVASRLILRHAFNKILGDFTMRAQQFYLRRENLASNGKPVTYSSYREIISDAYEAMTRRSECFKDYVFKLREACEVQDPPLFTPTHLTATWLNVHYSAAERANTACTIKLPQFYLV